MYLSLTGIPVFGFLYLSFAKKIEQFPGSGATLFILIGLFIGPLGIGVLDMSGSNSEVRMLADFTLAMLLFSDAAGIKLGELKKSSRLPLRMLLGGIIKNELCWHCIKN